MTTKQLKIIDNEQGLEFDTSKNYGDEHVKVYFRVESGYFYDTQAGYKEKEEAFKKETQKIFEGLGWQFLKSNEKTVSDTAKNGTRALHLHPQNFSGVVLKNEIMRLADALSSAETFNIRRVDTYGTYHAISKDAYMNYLEQATGEIRKRIFEEAKTNRAEKMIESFKIIQCLTSAFLIECIDEEDASPNSKREMTEKYIENIIDEMKKEGYLVTTDREWWGFNMRSVNKKEIKRLGLKEL